MVDDSRDGNTLPKLDRPGPLEPEGVGDSGEGGGGWAVGARDGAGDGMRQAGQPTRIVRQKPPFSTQDCLARACAGDII